MGSSSRNNSITQYATPGPGPAAAYLASLITHNGKRISFTKADRKKEKGSGAPGPGAYNLKHVTGTEGRKISFIERRRDISPIAGKTSPGPCAYDPNSSLKKSQGFSLGRGKRCNLTFDSKDTPGPLAYFAKDNLLKTSSPHWAYL